MTFEGREYAITVGSDLTRDGMFAELDDVTGGGRETVAEVFYSDADGSMALTQFAPAGPAGALAWLREQAARRLPPRTDAV